MKIYAFTILLFLTKYFFTRTFMRMFLCPSRNRLPLNKKKLPIDKAYQLTVFALIYFLEMFKLRSLIGYLIYPASRLQHLQ